MKLFNVPLEERQASLIHAYREITHSETINIALRRIVNRLEDIPEVKELADERDKQRRKMGKA